jgi:hypothetical protein
MKIDREWDLAALIIWKPNVQPLPVSTQAPQLGERLTIAGYGSGWFRAVSGRCVEYFSPGGNHPAEIVELSVPARNGDSGGPILNDRGEIAGVLFGSDSTSTMGSYCGRLRQFLAPLAGDFERLPPPPNMIARQMPNPSANQLPVTTVAALSSNKESPQNTVSQNIAAIQNHQENRGSSLVKVPTHAPPVAQVASGAQVEKVQINKRGERPEARIERKDAPGTATSDIPFVQAAIPASATTVDKDTSFNQLKNFLAVIGVLALFIQGLKILGKATG